MNKEDAMFCGRALFSFMEPLNGELKFAMKKSRPTERTQQALDWLVKHRKVSVKVYPSGAMVYIPLVKFRHNYAHEAKQYEGWKITELVP